MLAPPAVATKYSRFSARTFVQNHPRLKDCCNPKCDLTIRICAEMQVGGVAQTELHCDSSLGGCGTMNCGQPGCYEEAHFPCACRLVPKWMAKCDADGGLFAWIADNSIAGNGQNTDGVKPCPSCGVH